MFNKHFLIHLGSVYRPCVIDCINNIPQQINVTFMDITPFCFHFNQQLVGICPSENIN